MGRYCKRLIEVDLPIKRISAHSRREKSIRHGHICTLHIWWARRPLAACRAVICAALWPDPIDDICPKSFRENARVLMQEWAADHIDLVSEESWSRFVSIQKDSQRIMDNKVLQAALLDFIADYSNWDNSKQKDYLETSQALTNLAHEALGGELGTRPLVVDPFAGGGSIPLEALRVGADVFSSDLNPVATLINKLLLEYIPRYGYRLADEVRRWGQWIKKEAVKELAEFYPKDPDGAIPIAYLWSRTILSEAPGTEDDPIEVPLIRSLWLVKKNNRKRALRWVRDRQDRVQTETVEIVYANGRKYKVRRPLLEIFVPTQDSAVEEGTVARGSVTCPVTGFTTPVTRVRVQLKARQGGVKDARLFCVVTKRPETQGSYYRLPTTKDWRDAWAAAEELEQHKQKHKGELSLVPNETLPVMSGVFNAPLYGHDNWGSLFSSRQALALTVLVKLVHEAGDRLKHEHDEGMVRAVQLCLAFALDRQSDYLSSLVVWANTGEFIAHTFGRQALPIVWEWPECNPWGDGSGNWDGAIDWIYRVICANSLEIELGHSQTEQASATNLPLPDDSVQAFITDPPYYNAVPYADLSDFFYVWLHRSIGVHYPGLFQSSLSPKSEECCEMAGWDPVRYRHKDSKWFETQMLKAMEEGRRILAPDGVCVVVFAHKSTSGWEAILQAMIEAGWIITSSWPIDTERPGRLRAQNSAALASSVHLICRPRENPDGSLQTDKIGDWRDLLAELPQRIHEWMPRLAKEGVVGADAIFACLGPALEIYSRYSSVEKASGEKVALKEYLEEVWAAIAHEALSMIFEGADASGFEEDARLTAMWLWTLRTSVENGKEMEGKEEDKVKSLHGFSLEYDAARKIAQGLGAHLENLSHLVEVKGDTATLLTAGARTRYLFGKDATYVPKGRKKKLEKQMKLGFEEELKELEEEPGDWTIDLSGGAGSTVLDQLHQCMVLFDAGRGEALRRFLVDDAIGRNPLFWRLAQALSALYPIGSDEKRWVDGVLARKKGLGF